MLIAHKVLSLSKMLSRTMTCVQKHFERLHACQCAVQQHWTTPDAQAVEVWCSCDSRACTSLGRMRMIVRVVMSSETRTPEISFFLSTFVRQPTTYLGPLLAFTMTTGKYKAFHHNCKALLYDRGLPACTCFDAELILSKTVDGTQINGMYA